MPAQYDWDDFRFFLAVARHGSLSGAARALGVNHTTVLRRVAGLEATAGVQLFVRLPAGYALTTEGEEVLAIAARVEEDIAAASRRLSGKDARVGGSLSVTTIDILALHMLPRPMAAFRAARPEIQVSLMVAEARLSLTKREADVAVRSTRKPPENLVGRAVSGMAFAVYGSTAYLERAGAGVDLAGHDWAGLDESYAHTSMARWQTRRIPADRVGYRVNSVAALLEATRAGGGLALLPCGLGDAAPDLRRIGDVVEEAESRIWLLTHEDLRHMGRVRVFLDFMAEALSAERDLWEGRRGG
ncbi:LysR family transcriptional regulator [Azospirillum sp. sgz301742]